jgi:hypothetical protein
MASPHATASPEHEQEPPTKQYPSDKIRYKEKVGGRSTNITLNAKVAARLFDVQVSLKTLSCKAVSTPATLGWLLDHCAVDIAVLKRKIHEANAGGGQGRVAPAKEGELLYPGIANILPGVSPSRVLPSLRRTADDWDEELGFMSLDNDPDILESVEEEVLQELAEKEDEMKVYIGETSKLLEFVKLFPPVCPVRECGHRMQAERVGSTHLTTSLYLICPDGHKSLWRSAEEAMDSQVPQVVQRVFHGALCEGMGFTEFSEFASEVGFKAPSERAWYEFQAGTLTRKGWMSAVLEVSEEDLEAVRKFVKERDAQTGTVVYADARFDSSRDGYHGTVPILDEQTGKLLHIVTLTRIETGSSWKTEDACIRKAFEELQAWGMNISECAHDDKASVDSILTELGIHSSKDLWHKAKKLCGKLKEDLGKAKKGQLGSVNDAKSVDDLMTLTVPILKAYMKEAGLDLKGKKAALVDRLWKHLDKEEVVADDAEGRLLKFPEVSKYKLADKLKTHIYTVCRARASEGDNDVQALCRDLHNAADHWAGDHSVCKEIVTIGVLTTGPRLQNACNDTFLQPNYYTYSNSDHVEYLM